MSIDFFYKLSVSEWIIIGVYLLFFVIQMLYYLLIFRKPYKYATLNKESRDKKNNDKLELPGISIIITAKNEDENLEKNLPYILNQDYPNFQVVVVNNGSTDETETVLNALSQNHTNLYHTYIPTESEVINHKKLALTLGIKAAKHDILLFTEPDTKPLSKKWVYEYAKEFMKGKKVVLGFCQLELKEHYSKKLIHFDNLFFGIKYLGMALSNKPYLGMERNMAYKKELFFQNKGFSSILNIEYGEDNLFINKVATKKNTSVVLSPDSMVVSNVIDRISTWRNIKAKYLITRKHLKGFKTRLLDIEIFSRYGFYSLFAFLTLIGILQSSIVLIGIAVLFYLLRYFMQMVIINKNSRLFNAGKFYFSLSLLDLIVPIMNHQFLNYEKQRNRNIKQR